MNKKTNSNLLKHKSYRGMTLLEMMIAVAIVGILAAISLPSYNNYVTKAYLSEAMVFLERAKLAVNIYHKDGGDLADLTNTNASFRELGLNRMVNTGIVDRYRIIAWRDNDITIRFRVTDGSPLPSELYNKWPFYLAGNVSASGDIVWECLSDVNRNKFVKYVPTDCR